jgi:cysteine synthase
MSSVLATIGHTPLVPLQRIAQGLPVPILAKCEQLNPGGSVKDRIALAIVDDAIERGLMPAGGTLIEATAGNTGVGLALVAAQRGYRLVCVMPAKMSRDKQRQLETLGARVIITPNKPPGDRENFQVVAERLAQENGWFLTDQFRNPANVRAHETTTGPELLVETRGRIGAFVAGAGTGGTITGVGRCLKGHAPGVKIVLADPVGSVLAEWVRTGRVGKDAPYQVEGIGASQPPAILDRTIIDGTESISDAESFAMCLRLIREEGLLVGGSAGTAVAAAVRVAQSGTVDGPVIVLLPDSWDRYRSCAWMATRSAD